MNLTERQLLETNNVYLKNKKISFLDSIQKSIAIGSWQVNMEKNEVRWSETTKKIHEVPMDFQPSLETAIEFIPEGKYRDRLLTDFEDAVNLGKTFDIELAFVSAKNNHKWVRAVGYPVIKKNKCIEIQGIFQDITEQREKLNKLALREEQLRTTWENSPNGMALVSLRGRIKSVNNTLCHLFGYEQHELTGKNFIEFTHPEDRTIGKSEIMSMIMGDTTSSQTEIRYLKKNGAIVYTLLSLSIVRDTNNKPLHFIANINDISGKKNAENEIKRLLHTTENQNMRLINFAHIVSHNLRSHSGNLETLLNLMETERPEATKNEFFPLIKSAVNNLSETILNLNEVSTINTKKHEDVVALNLLKYVNRAIIGIQADIIENEVEYTIKVPKNYEVLAIPAYLESILLNFLTNSIKYKKKSTNPVISISAKKISGYIKLDIEDNGQGIDLKMHGHKLFGMYKTFHSHKDARGIGLFITKNQIEALGGYVEVESEVGLGSKFSVYLRFSQD